MTRFLGALFLDDPDARSRGAIASWVRAVCLGFALLGLSSGAAQAQVVTEFSGLTPGVIVYGITAGPDGNLWFTETFTPHAMIGRITPLGVVTEFSISTGPFTGFEAPVDITKGPDGNLWFTENAAIKIGRITPLGVVTEFDGTAGGGTRITAQPWGITAGPDGNLWFTELFGNKIGRITTDGVVTEFDGTAGGGTSLNHPTYITLGPDDNLWFTEGAGNKIGRIIALATNGVVGHVDLYDVPTASADLRGITAGPDGALWFTEQVANKIGRITTAGVVTNEYDGTAGGGTGITAGASLNGITAGPDGNVWFTEGAGRIGRIIALAANGTVGHADEFSAGITPPAQPMFITAGPDGALWFSEFGVTRIGRITTGATTGAVVAVGLVEDAHATGGTESNVNNILEPGETVLVNPSWRNIGSSPLALTGTASSFEGPAGATYSLFDSAADYGTIAPGATADSFSAGGPSYRLSVSNPVIRPVAHWDATFFETLSTGDTKTWTLHVGQSFTDVPVSNGAYPYVENIFHNGITTGCATGMFCPDTPLLRWQAAIFLARAIVGPGGVVPASGVVPSVGSYDCSSGGNSLFADVSKTDVACPAIHFIYSQGITAGCGGGNYCPNLILPRWQSAILLAHAMLGPGVPIPTSGTVPGPYNCTGGGTSLFGDVAPTDTACPAIHYIYSQSVTTGCGGGNYCPIASSLRWQMAVFLVRAFNIPFLY